MEPDYRLLYDLIVIVEAPARIRDRKNEYFHKFVLSYFNLYVKGA